MLIKYTQEAFNAAKSRDKLDLECKYCSKIFQKTKTEIKSVLGGKKERTLDFCSVGCLGAFNTKNKTQNINCDLCNKIFLTNLYNLKQPKKHYCSNQCRHAGSKKEQFLECPECHETFIQKLSVIKRGPIHFCSKSCRATYSNKHKIHIRSCHRSRLEIFIEEKLGILFPQLKFEFNDRKTLGGLELDIFCKDLMWACELNGIFHYIDVHKDGSLIRMQNNDAKKIKLCIEKGISLCVLDVSPMNYFKPEKAQKFLDIITKIINEKLAAQNTPANI